MKQGKTTAKKGKNSREALIIGLVALLTISLFTLYQRMDSYLQAQKDLEASQEEAAALEKEYQENMRLLIQSDSQALMEKLAREELGMVKSGETVYRLSPTLTETKPSEAQPEENIFLKVYQSLSSFFSSIIR